MSIMSKAEIIREMGAGRDIAVGGLEHEVAGWRIRKSLSF